MERHGIDFVETQGLWAEPHIVVPAKNAGGELRWALMARLHGDCWMALFTMRGETVRLISCHRADRRWERRFEDREEKKNDS